MHCVDKRCFYSAYEVTADDMVDKGVECIYFSDTLEELLDKVTSSIVEEYPVLNNKGELIDAPLVEMF